MIGIVSACKHIVHQVRRATRWPIKRFILSFQCKNSAAIISEAVSITSETLPTGYVKEEQQNRLPFVTFSKNKRGS
jgi:hypothetical protein